MTATPKTSQRHPNRFDRGGTSVLREPVSVIGRDSIRGSPACHHRASCVSDAREPARGSD